MDPINLVRLRDFSDGTDAGMRQLADMFLTHMDECAEALADAVAGSRLDHVRAEAHRTAGTAGACGAQPLAQLLGTLETLDAQQLAEQAPALVKQIEEEMANVRAFFATIFEPRGEEPPAGREPSNEQR